MNKKVDVRVGGAKPTFLSDIQDERKHVVNKFVSTFVEKMEEPDAIVQKVLEDNLWDLV